MTLVSKEMGLTGEISMPEELLIDVALRMGILLTYEDAWVHVSSEKQY